MMQDTTSLTFWFRWASMEGEPVEPWLVLSSEEDVGKEVEGEKSNASSVDQETAFPLVWGGTIELVVGQLPLGACLSVPS